MFFSSMLLSFLPYYVIQWQSSSIALELLSLSVVWLSVNLGTRDYSATSCGDAWNNPPRVVTGGTKYARIIVGRCGPVFSEATTKQASHG
mmetsp:Transcript_39484/g.39935  ORF Transcript_39484/g.39935 Transcript_39484/m.39935 type:complete len:90 (-) Transcript_39484:577-846(-)